MRLVEEIYAATGSFPREEQFGMTSQLRRAAVSISSNIAEGYGRETTGAYIQFLRIGMGSARETHSLIELAKRLEFIPATAAESLEGEVIRISKMLRSLIRALERKSRT